MKKLTKWLMAAAFLIALTGCKEESPPADAGGSYEECWSGQITDIYTEGGGADFAEVVALEPDGHDTMYFTLVEDTEYIRYDAGTGEAEAIGKEGLYTGAWAEIDCTSYQNSGYHPIRSITVIENTDPEEGGRLLWKSPPSLTVVHGETSVEALKGTYSWTYQNEDGTSVSTEADSMHPLQAEAYMPALVLLPVSLSHMDPLAAHLQFGISPDTVRIHCWGGDAWGDTDAPWEDIEADMLAIDFADGQSATAYQITLKDGSYIYEVIAEWNCSEAFHGTAHYSFYTAEPEIQSVES